MTPVGSNAPNPGVDPKPKIGPGPDPAVAPAFVPGQAPGANPERRYQQRKPETPRRVRHGLKLHHKEGALRSALATRWLRLIEAQADPAAMAAGLEYARAGQIVSIELRTGSVDAAVQGTAFRPYAAKIGVPSLDAAQWDSVVQAMAGEAVYVAKLLANELPVTIDDLFGGLGLALLPAGPGAATFQCACGAPLPCKHIAAAAYLVAERLGENPLLIFSVLGMAAERLLEQVRRARTIQTHGTAAAHSDAVIPESQIPQPPLDACLDEFWHAGAHLGEIDAAPMQPHVPHALLRRLGPSPMSGKFPLVGLLASIYDTVAASANRLMDQVETAEADARGDEAPSSEETPEEG